MSFAAAIAEGAARQLAVVLTILLGVGLLIGLTIGYVTFVPSPPATISPACQCDDREFRITCGCETPCMCGVVCK